MPPTDRDRQPFVNYATGTFTDASKEWFLHADQWSQAYYQFRDGKLFFCENDNKEQQYTEREIDVAAFVRDHAETKAEPYPGLVAFLDAVRRDDGTV